MRIITIAIALVLLPFAANAQMKCPDGSYRTACPGGDGQAVQGDGLSSYTAPEVQERPIAPVQGQQQRRQRRPDQSSNQPSQGTRGPMSVDERARAAGISRNDLVRARSRGNVIEGMMEKDLVDILGRPETDRQSTANINCRVMRWYGRYNRLTDTVYLCNGQVRSHSHYSED